jgi:hypothetical protein
VRRVLGEPVPVHPDALHFGRPVVLFYCKRADTVRGTAYRLQLARRCLVEAYRDIRNATAPKAKAIAGTLRRCARALETCAFMVDTHEPLTDADVQTVLEDAWAHATAVDASSTSERDAVNACYDTVARPVLRLSRRSRDVAATFAEVHILVRGVAALLDALGTLDTPDAFGGLRHRASTRSRRRRGAKTRRRGR